MLIAADIGNTTIDFGIFDTERNLLKKFSISALIDRTSDESYLLINSFLDNYNLIDDINCSVISSVNPNRLNSIYDALYNICNKKPFVIGNGTKTGFPIKTDSAKEVGSDIISNIAACNSLYTVPSIVLDLGTVNTISFINNKNEFLGTIIAPGAITAHESLISSAAQLYDVSFKKPDSLLGKNTIDSILSGSFNSVVYAIDGFIDSLTKEYNLEIDNLSIIGTGSNAELLLPYSKYNAIINKDLTLIGEATLFSINSKII